jgi:hypothetical protein
VGCWPEKSTAKKSNGKKSKMKIQIRKYFGTSRVILLLLGLGCIAAEELLRTSYKDHERELFLQGIGQYVQGNRTADEAEQTVFMGNAQLAFENEIYAYRKVQEEQGKSWWQRFIFPGPDELCAARSQENIGTCLARGQAFEDADLAYVTWCSMFIGGEGTALTETWIRVAHNLEVIRQRKRDQEEQQNKDGGKSGKDKGKSQNSPPKSNKPAPSDHKSSQDPNAVGGKGKGGRKI